MHNKRCYGFQHNDTQHNGLICDTQHNDTKYIVLNVIYAECHDYLNVMLIVLPPYKHKECLKKMQVYEK